MGETRRCYEFVPFPLFLSFVQVVLLGGSGKKEMLGDPSYDRASWFGAGNG